MKKSHAHTEPETNIVIVFFTTIALIIISFIAALIFQPDNTQVPDPAPPLEEFNAIPLEELEETEPSPAN